MDKNIMEKNEDLEIDLHRVFPALLKKAWLIAMISILLAVVFFLGTYFFITPEYEAAAKFYVNNSSISVGGTSVSISSGDLVTSRNLVDSYIVILKTRETLNDVIDYAGVDYSYGKVLGMISAEAVDETEIFQVKVTSTNPQEAEKLANAIAYILPNRIGNIIEGTSAKVVEAAIIPASPSSPNYTANTVLGFALGFVLTAAVIVVRVVFDTVIREEDDVTQSVELPILTAVPDIAKVSSRHYGYSREKDKNRAAVDKKTGKKATMIGGDIGFAALEAYKLLRTKLKFSFAAEKGCRVIGVTSAMSGEGKSLTAINMAYSLSELGERVVLIDCDMRRPTLAEKLGINKKPGLSSYLTGQSDLTSLIQYCGIKDDEKAFHVIAAGQNPPNPIELLSSNRMMACIKAMREHYDYVILDLAPVGEVSDALALAGIVDGMLLVVRQNYCNRIALSETARQLEFVNMKLLGVVLNATVENSGQYGKKYYKYGPSRYGSQYARGKYATAQNSGNGKQR